MAQGDAQVASQMCDKFGALACAVELCVSSAFSTMGLSIRQLSVHECRIYTQVRSYRPRGLAAIS